MDIFTVRAALFTTGVAMGALTAVSVFGSSHDDLPLSSILIPMGIVVFVLGVGIATTGPTRLRLQWYGIGLMVYAATRGVAFAARTAGRTTGISEWLNESSPTWVWVIVFMQGFLVWARARHELNREGR